MLLCLACASVGIPPPGSPEEQRVIEQGRQVDRQIRREFGVYEDAELQAHVSRIGERLAAKSEWPGLPWKFTVLDSPSVNAFAVPGGLIYVTRGILSYMNSEAELAGVLGHEIAHVTGRHAAEQQRRSTLANLGILVGAVFAPEVAQVALGTGLAQTALQLVFLKYSRDQEREADRVGIRYAVAGGYDPRGIGEFFQTLQALEAEEGGPDVPGWASTHPEVEDRIETNEGWAREAMQRAGVEPGELTVDREGHLHAVDGIVFGADPRAGYMEGDDFLHPDLRFAITFPSGWEVDNSRNAVLAVGDGQDAAIQLTLADAREGETPREYAARMLGEIEARVADSGSTRVNGLPAFRAVFEARGRSGAYGVLGLWVTHRGRLYQILGLTSPGDFSAYRRVFDSSLSSFRELTDPDALGVAPARLAVTRVPARQTLSEFLEGREVSVDPGTIALINGMRLDDALVPGSLVKRVVGGRPGPTGGPMCQSGWLDSALLDGDEPRAQERARDIAGAPDSPAGVVVDLADRLLEPRHALLPGLHGGGHRDPRVDFPVLHGRQEALGIDALFSPVRRQGVGRCEGHLVGDSAGTHVEDSPEDTGETQGVVDLVGEIAAAAGDDARTGFAGDPRPDLGDRVGTGEDNGVVGHLPDPLGPDDLRPRGREGDADVGPA